MDNFKIIPMQSVAKQLNDITFTDYFYRLMLLAKSVFKWNNLPNGIDEKWIEQFLFTEGQCIFYRDEEKGFMVAKNVVAGQLNYYGEPTRFRAYGIGYNGPELNNYMGRDLEEIKPDKFNTTDCVLIRNNDDLIPTSPTIQLYALQLAEITRTIQININSQKTPLFIKGSNRQMMTLKQVYKQWNGNEPVIFGDKSLEENRMEAVRTEAPIVFDKLQIQKHAIWNECMTFLGVNNANMDKKERLVSNEVEANNGQVELASEIMLKSRQRACELINKLFGLNISVELRKPEIVQNGTIRDIEEIEMTSIDDLPGEEEE